MYIKNNFFGTTIPTLAFSILLVTKVWAIGDDSTMIAVNQLGYETKAPKRFTVPTIKDGTAFIIRRSDGNKALFKGEILNHIGDFSKFQPLDSEIAYLVVINNEISDPFFIREDLFKENLWKLTLNFMIDCRSVVGTHPSAYGGCPWRDGTYYSYEVPSLIWLYKSNPVFFENLPVQINYEDEKRRVLTDDFQFDANNPQSDGVMEAVTRYYTELDPLPDDAPDIVKLIHWGLGFYLMKPYTKEPANDPLPKQIHSQTVEQFAYFLNAWEELKFNRWISETFYDRCYHFALTHWKASGSLDIEPLWKPKNYDKPYKKNDKWALDKNSLNPFKGRHVPGHSILANLMMYQVVKKKNESIADQFLSAAQRQTKWIIDSLDWSDPRTTKGQRGSEFQTIVNLVWFLRNMPEHAPKDLQLKIENWAKIAVSRSDNMWDFRRYDLKDHWTIPVMNETGNLAGFPACAISASWIVENDVLKKRLVQLAYSHVDNLMGRNPKFAAAYTNSQYFIERCWPKSHREDACARLELCRGGIDASPGTEMYPFNPDGEFRHPEGWVNWNAAFNVGLAFLEFNKNQ